MSDTGPRRAPVAVRPALDLDGPLPKGVEAGPLLRQAAARLFAHALFNALPRLSGYITASPAAIGILGDLLASALSANVGARVLSPAPTEVEAQAVRRIAQLIGFPATCGGVMVSGGNVANLVGCWAARTAKAGWDVRARWIPVDAAQRMDVNALRRTRCGWRCGRPAPRATAR